MRELSEAEADAITDVANQAAIRIREALGYEVTVYPLGGGLTSPEIVMAVTEPVEEIELTVIVRLAE